MDRRNDLRQTARKRIEGQHHDADDRPLIAETEALGGDVRHRGGIRILLGYFHRAKLIERHHSAIPAPIDRLEPPARLGRLGGFN